MLFAVELARLTIKKLLTIIDMNNLMLRICRYKHVSLLDSPPTEVRHE